MNRNHFVPFICALLLFGSCACDRRPAEPVTIDIQPYSGFPDRLTNQVSQQLQKVFPHVRMLQKTELPASTFYEPNKRYRADKLIKILQGNTDPQHVTIGLTHFDISTTKGNKKDWGIMGLGYKPGNACIVSTFRLNRKNLESQFYKLCIHELGHTAGLDHCPVKTCFMRDAKGGNPIDEEIGFCEKCRNFLVRKGWSL